MWPTALQLRTLRLQLDRVIYSLVSETFQKTTPFSPGRQVSKKLVD